MDEYLKPPQDRRFYRRYAFALCTVGLNSQVWSWFDMPKNKFIRLQRFLMLTMEPIATWSQIIFCFLHRNEYSFGELTVMLSIIPICVNIMMKLIIAQTKTYKDGIATFMNEIHLYNIYQKNPRDEYVKMCLITAERYTMKAFYILLVVQFYLASSWQAVPIYNGIVYNPDLNNITQRLDMIIHLWLPFDYEYNFKAWVLTTIVGMYCTYLGILVMFLFDTLMLTCLFHLIGHIKIYHYKLKTLFKGGQSQLEIREILVQLSIEYNQIKKILRTLEGCFDWYLVTTYAQNLFEGAVLLYGVTSQDLTWEILVTYCALIPHLQGLLIFTACLLEYVRITADDIPTLIYNLKWEDMSVSNQKMVWMLLFQMQPTFEFKAACNLKTGVQPAINIIKTTFSYYVMLKAKNDIN